MDSIRRIDTLAGAALLILLVVGTVLVMRPFIASLVWAAVLAYATWPVYEWLLARLDGRSALAATAMTLLLLISMVGPFAMMGVGLADNVAGLVRILRDAMERPLPALPAWIQTLPLIGSYIDVQWQALREGDEGALLLQLREWLVHLPLREWAINAGGALGRGVVLITFSVVICFFFYRDGPAITARLNLVMERLTGHR
ncbi:MAG: AI-2E family transporter, partial [Thiohalobacteraceae bacterium]